MNIELSYFGKTEPQIRVEFDNHDGEITIDSVIHYGEEITHDPTIDLNDIAFEVSMALRLCKADAQEAMQELRGEEMFEERRGN